MSNLTLRNESFLKSPSVLLNQVSTPAQNSPNSLAMQTIAQPILSDTLSQNQTLQTKHITRVSLSREEYLKKTLTLILSDHLQLVIEGIYSIFIEALADKEMGPQLAPHILTLLTSNLSKILPKSFKKLAMIAEVMKQDKIEKHTPIFLTAAKDLIDDMLCDNELKTAFIDSLVGLLMPLFSETVETTTLQPQPIDITKNDKIIILSSITGIEKFFDDLIHAMQSHGSWLNTPDFNLLREDSKEGQACEDFIIDTMNANLEKEGLLTLHPQKYNKTEMDKNLFYITEKLFTAIFPIMSSATKEREALVHIAALCFSKCVEIILSSRTTLHLFDVFLHGNLTSFDVKNADSSSPSSYDKPFANSLDKHFRNLILHGVKLGTQNSSSYFPLIILTQLILQFNKGEMGKETILSIQKGQQSSDWLPFLTLLHDFLYHSENKNLESPALKVLYKLSDEEFRQRKKIIENSLNADIPFEKTHAVFKEQFQANFQQSRLSIFCWDFFITRSNVLKSLLRNFSNAVYILSQRERLMKMLYCYSAGHISQAIARDSGH